jgi:hypothetical protein
MANRYFNVKTGIKTGNITLDADSGNANVANIAVSRYIISNLNPGVSGTYTLGNASLRYKDVFLSNELNINGQSITANATTTTFAGNINANGIYSNTITVNNQLTINSSTDSNTTTSGSLITQGGVGIKKDLTVGGNINLANAAGNAKGVINYNDTSDSIDFKFNG